MIEEYTIFNFITDVGAPIASALFMGAFIFIIIRKIMDDVVGNTEELKGICKMLVTRIKVMNNDMIRIDSMVRTAMGIHVDVDRLARADGKKDQRKD